MLKAERISHEQFYAELVGRTVTCVGRCGSDTLDGLPLPEFIDYEGEDTWGGTGTLVRDRENNRFYLQKRNGSKFYGDLIDDVVYKTYNSKGKACYITLPTKSTYFAISYRLEE